MDKKKHKPEPGSLGWALFRSEYTPEDPIDVKETDKVEKAVKGVSGEMSNRLLKLMNSLVVSELNAFTTYMHQASVANGYGYGELANHFWEEVGEEVGHAMKLMDRINLFGRVPTITNIPDVKNKFGVTEMLEHQLELEKGALQNYNEAVHIAREEADEGTADLLTEILRDEELHFDWLTAQLSRIKAVGEARYISEIEQEDPDWEDGAPTVEIED